MCVGVVGVEVPGNKVEAEFLLEAVIDELGEIIAAGVGDGGAADFGVGKCFENRIDRHLVKLHIVGGVGDEKRAAAVFADVGFVADFPVGDDGFVDGIALHEGGNYLLPFIDVVRPPDLLIDLGVEDFWFNGDGGNDFATGGGEGIHV